ncbi:MAG: hypothetical protein SO108_05240 [Bacilli bacterium]|nr:hypothetical protein [Bacilli bacterium]
MNFSELIIKTNSENLKNIDVLNSIISNIDITSDNFNTWIEKVFSDEVEKFDMSKLPYLIDGLYKSDDKLKFMLCCMLIESTCDKLHFMTSLERYPVFKAKFETMLNTLVTVYDRVDNGIANCMSLILINNDPKLELLNEEQKSVVEKATVRKLNDILNYLRSGNVNPFVYYDLEVIIDFACYMNNQNIRDLISKIDDLEDNQSADLFIIKYKLINNMPINENKVRKFRTDNAKLFTLYSIMEKLGVQDKYLNSVSQEELALSDMKRWLSYSTELGSEPDMIELLGEFIFNEQKCFAYKFKKNGFSIEGELIGISGGYPINKVSANASGYTFSKFEKVESNWQQQAVELATFISNYWKERVNNQKK